MTIEQLHKEFLLNPSITTDSRNCPNGAIFFALHGDNFDGNQFATAALEKGCRLAVVDAAKAVLDDRYILVNNTLTALQELAKYHRKAMTAKIIGITGTNGKTTTKELIAAVLKTQINTLFTQGNLNNHIGVPLTLLNLTQEHTVGIIEMGANHVGEIAELCNLSDPDFGIITNVGKAHLEGFGSFEGVIKTKTELYRHIEKKDATLFVNKNNPLLKGKAKTQNIIWYGDSKTIRIDTSWPTLRLIWNNRDDTTIIQTQLSGAYNLENIAAAIAIGEFFDITNNNIKNALEAYTPSNNRSQIIKSDKNTIIMDAYNANPTSMHAAIHDFADSDYQNKILILGDMKELGEYSTLEHQKILNDEVLKNFSKVLFIGTEFKNVFNICETRYCFESRDELLVFLKNEPIEDATVLLKGSRSMRLENAISLL